MRRAAAPSQEKLLPNIRNVVAVASGKGGVGKSTVSVNLAVALAQSGARVGLLDADITGPNLPQMLGATGTPKSSPGGKIEPIERHGVKLISIQFFVPEGQPIVWRGPLIGGAIQQFCVMLSGATSTISLLTFHLEPLTRNSPLHRRCHSPVRCWSPRHKMLHSPM